MTVASAQETQVVVGAPVVRKDGRTRPNVTQDDWNKCLNLCTNWDQRIEIMEIRGLKSVKTKQQLLKNCLQFTANCLQLTSNHFNIVYIIWHKYLQISKARPPQISKARPPWHPKGHMDARVMVWYLGQKFSCDFCNIFSISYVKPMDFAHFKHLMDSRTHKIKISA